MSAPRPTPRLPIFSSQPRPSIAAGCEVAPAMTSASGRPSIRYFVMQVGIS